MAAFVGRTQELLAIESVLRQAADNGSCHVIVVRGEAGIGKSRLLRQVLDESESGVGGRFHTGYGQAMATSLESEAYTAIRECLRDLVATSHRDLGFFQHLTRALVKSAPDWLAAVPIIGDALAGGAAVAVALRPDEDSETSVTHSSLHQLVNLVECLADDSPLLLVLDDLHSADLSTLDAIVSMAMNIDKPLVMVLSYRITDAAAQALRGGAGYNAVDVALLRVQRYLASQCRFHEITLGRLDDTAMRELVEAELHEQSLRTNEIDRIMERAGGNPLFASTLAQLPWDRRAQPDSLLRGQDAITAVLREQLTFLGDSNLAILECAAVIGLAFEVDYLASLARKDVDDIYDIVDSVQRRGSIVDPYVPRGSHERYAFHHPLLFELLRERAQENGPRWRRLNARLLDVYSSEAVGVGAWNDDVVVRAVECARISRNEEETHRIALVAARRQLQLGAVPQALLLARCSLDHSRGAAEKVAAARVLMEGLIESADNQGCADVFESLEVETLEASEEAQLCALAYARCLRMLGRWNELDEQLSAILGDVHSAAAGGVEARALMLRAEAELCGPIQRTGACLDTLQEVLRRSEDDDLTARALGHTALALLAEYRASDAQKAMQECVSVARESGDAYVIYEAIHWESKIAMALLSLDEAERLLAELAAISQKHGVAGQRPYHARDLSRVQGLQGKVREAAGSYCAYFDLQQGSNRDRAIATLAAQVSELREVHGADAARALVAELVSICPDPAFSSLSATLEHAGAVFDAQAFCVEQMGISRSDYLEAEAIFRFDVPSLETLRGQSREP